MLNRFLEWYRRNHKYYGCHMSGIRVTPFFDSRRELVQYIKSKDWTKWQYIPCFSNGVFKFNYIIKDESTENI